MYHRMGILILVWMYMSWTSKQRFFAMNSKFGLTPDCVREWKNLLAPSLLSATPPISDKICSSLHPFHSDFKFKVELLEEVKMKVCSDGERGTEHCVTTYIPLKSLGICLTPCCTCAKVGKSFLNIILGVHTWEVYGTCIQNLEKGRNFFFFAAPFRLNTQYLFHCNVEINP